MVKEKLIRQILQLPPNLQQEAADFVDFLSKRCFEEKNVSSKNSVLNSSFRGMWKNRGEMEDSTRWVRNIRKSRFVE